MTNELLALSAPPELFEITVLLGGFLIMQLLARLIGRGTRP
jgi:hypothetical protein